MCNLTIAVTSFNRISDLRRCIWSVLELRRFLDFRLVVCDNCSTDGSVQFLRDCFEANALVFDKLLIQSENIGFDRNFQTVISLVETPYLFPIGDDDELLASAQTANEFINLMEEGVTAALLQAIRMDEGGGRVGNYLGIEDVGKCFEHPMSAFAAFYGKTPYGILLYSTSWLKEVETEQYVETHHLYACAFWASMSLAFECCEKKFLFKSISRAVIMRYTDNPSWSANALNVRFVGMYDSIANLPDYYEPLKSAKLNGYIAYIKKNLTLLRLFERSKGVSTELLSKIKVRYGFFVLLKCRLLLVLPLAFRGVGVKFSNKIKVWIRS